MMDRRCLWAGPVHGGWYAGRADGGHPRRHRDRER